MLPIRLEIKNFLAYRSPDSVRFDGIHLACLTGVNGAGKSSLLDAITWALWGKARAKRDEELVHLGQNDMYVLLEFEQQGLRYQVIRRRNRGRSVGSLELFSLDEDGNPNNISEPNMRATQERINRLLNLDYETFVHSAFLQQGKADAFTTKTPRERKQILSDILGLARWEGYEEAAKAKVKEIETEIATLRLRIEEIEEEIKGEPTLKAAVVEAENQQAEAQKLLDLAEAALKQVEQAPTEMRSAQRTRADIEQRLKGYESDLNTAEKEIERQQKRVAHYEGIVALQDEIEAGYAALQEAREADHALGDKLMQLSDLEERRRGFERQVEAARADLQTEIGRHDATIAALEKTINAAQPEALEQLHSEVETFAALETENTALQDQLTTLSNERSGLEATNVALRPEMTKLKERIDRLEAAEGATCPLCG
ncbi:MAG TPA: SMC family ATPase, partial [Phototrophicaceae bacterium]|nr:SMC family ATPase [Phototrophicaceae bacterium]